MRAAVSPVLLALTLGCAAVGASVPTPGSEGDRAATDALALPRPFLGERFSYDRMSVPLRVISDVAAIPSGATRWGASDWSQLGLWSTGIAALMIPAPRSVDARLDDFFRRELNPRLPEVWSVPMQATLWGGLAAGYFGTWLWAHQTDHETVAQGLSLMGESLAVAQTYHVGIKLLFGRQGPRPDGSEPRVEGPGVGFQQYPAGAPSGHAATLYSLMSAGFAYFDPPAWAQVTGHVLAATLVTFHAIDHRHYASDLIWGSAMGWYVGQWVVKHRAVRRTAGAADAVPAARVMLLPAPLPDGAAATLTVAY